MLQGGNANDILAGGTGNDAVDGKDGSDTYLMGAGDGFDVFNDTGNSGTDRIVATGDNVQIGALSIAGIEEISSGGFQHVKLIGSPSIHTTFDLSNVALHGIEEVWMPGTTSNDTIWTSNFSDAVGGQNYRGGPGNDTFHLGSQGANLLVSSADNGGFDSFQGNTADATHTVIADTADTVVGIAGTYGGVNSVDVITGAGQSDVTIAGGSVHNNWDFTDTTLVNIARIYGGDGTSNDTIVGSKGDDVIYGLGGNDVLRGGEGNDVLYGGIGNDILTGGTGSDTFAFSEHGAPNVDTILDYSAGQGDKIDLSGILDGHFSGADLSKFVDVEEAGDNGSATLRVDTSGQSGAGPGGGWQEVAVLSGAHTTDAVNLIFEQAQHQVNVHAHA